MIKKRLPSLDETDGFYYSRDVVSEAQEAEYIRCLDNLPLLPMKMRGNETRRLIGQFGGNVYNYHGAANGPAPLTPLLVEIRAMVAGIAGVESDAFAAVTCQLYPAHAGINWHIDHSSYGIVAGLSLGGGARLWFRHAEKQNGGAKWECDLQPRSLYVLSGRARLELAHRIPPVKSKRYSVTFRTLI
jgi:alkylated DNA repair dioxygenase AlkB